MQYELTMVDRIIKEPEKKWTDGEIKEHLLTYESGKESGKEQEVGKKTRWNSEEREMKKK